MILECNRNVFFQVATIPIILSIHLFFNSLFITSAFTLKLKAWAKPVILACMYYRKKVLRVDIHVEIQRQTNLSVGILDTKLVISRTAKTNISSNKKNILFTNIVIKVSDSLFDKISVSLWKVTYITNNILYEQSREKSPYVLADKLLIFDKLTKQTNFYVNIRLNKH